MEKLLNYFNEYNNIETDVYDVWTEKDFKNLSKERRYYMLSKDFGFIKWLVEQDKIDFDKLEEKTDCENIVGGYECADFMVSKDFDSYEEVLMRLSIQDNPIEFLISILKDKKVRTVYVDEDGNVSGDTIRYSDC